MSENHNVQQQTHVQDQALARSMRSALRFIIALMVVLALVWLGSGMVSVPADQEAVVIAFGDARVKASKGGGLLLCKRLIKYFYFFFQA